MRKNQSKKLVLLVDDSNAMRRLLSGILGEKYEVQTCKSAVEAIDWLSYSKKTPDVVLSDIAMSEMSGIEFGQYLNINDLYGQIPVVFMSGKSEEEFGAELNSVPYKGYAKKPFNPETLLNTIEAVA